MMSMEKSRLSIAQLLSIILGGFVKYKTNAVIGRGTLESLENYRFDKCFMGVNGIHRQLGFTTPDQEEAMIKEKAIALSREAFVVSDNTKFSEVSFAKITDLHKATIITNELDDEMQKRDSSKTTIKVVTI
jgi:DeoR family transcriptional regulator, fructose operon transcriptional repressor